jgi:essential nuclear protein 1
VDYLIFYFAMVKQNLDKKKFNNKNKKDQGQRGRRVTKVKRQVKRNAHPHRGRDGPKRKFPQRRDEKKSKAKITQIKKSAIKDEEKEIEFIENENDLFDDQGYYKANDNDAALDDWGNNGNDNDNTNDIDMNKNSTNINLSDILFKKMNEVEETKVDPRIIEAYQIVGDILSTYTSGKLPKAFNILPSTENWVDLIELTKPQLWSPQAMYEATIMFSSGLNALLAETFYFKFLLPAVREDIRRNKKLNIHYYNCLKKALFKPAGFFKGIILPLSNNANAKELSIIGSILKKCSIPMTHSSACIMKLMEFCTNARDSLSMGAFYFMKILLLKKYALPTPVKDAIVNFFCKYINHPHKVLPVLWHQTLLIFIQMYKNDLLDTEKNRLRELINIKSHHLITEEIVRELNYIPSKYNTVKPSSFDMKIDN